MTHKAEIKNETSTYDYISSLIVRIGQKVFPLWCHGVISILPLYENNRLHKYQQEIMETCLQVLNFEVDWPDVRKSKHSPNLFIKTIISYFLVDIEYIFGLLCKMGNWNTVGWFYIFKIKIYFTFN